MKKKSLKVLSFVLAMAMLLSVGMTGCGKGDTESKASGSSEKSLSSTQASEAVVAAKELLSVEVYDVAANYQGIQSGWFGKVIKEKFNMELNIIAPNIAGDAASVYQTRVASGTLGDIILLDNAEFLDCIQAGLLKDISENVYSGENLKAFETQINVLNESLTEGGEIYGIPSEMTSTSPETYSDASIFSSPGVPWDYYTALGAPQLKNLDDLLNLLAQMQEKYPTNEAGDPAYAISLWKDWDSFSMENVNLLTKWYGESAEGSVLLTTENTIRPLMEESGSYYKILKFFFDANQRGLVDPDSSVQDWTTLDSEKLRQKRVYLTWYSWQQSLANMSLTDEQKNAGEGIISIPVEDMHFYQVADSYYGTGRVWGVGSGVSEENTHRIVEFLDWLASPEAMTYMWAGVEGLTYTVRDDGKYALTDEASDYIGGNKGVPEELGGGGFSDGMSKLNQYVVSSLNMNPVTGDLFSSGFWTSEQEKPQAERIVAWEETFAYENLLDYTESKEMITMLPNINKILATDTTDIGLIRSQCGSEITNTSWKMVFASDEDAFQQLWQELQTKLDGLGYKTLVEFDTQKYQVVTDARKEAMKQ